MTTDKLTIKLTPEEAKDIQASIDVYMDAVCARLAGAVPALNPETTTHTLTDVDQRLESLHTVQRLTRLKYGLNSTLEAHLAWAKEQV